MIHFAECGKIVGVGVGDAGNMDRISSLPDELLVHILLSVSTLTATQTSILSTRWRHLYTLTSNLSFDVQEYFGIHGGLGKGKDVDEAVKTKFERFIYGVLASHKKSPIEKFSLSLGQNPSEHDCSHLHEWISAAIQKNVRHLHLGIITSHINFIPNCVFNSHTVVVLEIISYDEYLVIPELVCFPSLRTLELYSITFWNDGSGNGLFVGCPQLKDLTLRCCYLNRRWSEDNLYISAKALQNLIISWCDGFGLIDAPNLVNITYDCQTSSADLDVTSSSENPRPLDRVELGFVPSDMDKIPQVLFDVITGVHNVRELILKDESVELLSRTKEDPKLYSKLECLRLGSCRPNIWKYVTFLLENSPQLETIIFEVGLMDDDAEHEWPANSELAPFSSNVKTIEVHDFGGSKTELLLLEYLLENALALKRLIIYKLKTMKMEEELRISMELLMLPKASTECTIELKSGDNSELESDDNSELESDDN